jgi:hypothetical protein
VCSLEIYIIFYVFDLVISDLIFKFSMRDIFVFVELLHDTFTFLIDDILFLVLQNYLSLFLFCDQFFLHGY